MNAPTVQPESPLSPGSGPKPLVFVQGVLSATQIREACEGFVNAPICVEARSMGGFHGDPDVRHISEFGPTDPADSARAKARDWVAELSATVLKTTGKPIYQSFTYQGISAWWFLEIAFQEPAYLAIRRQEALRKAAAAHGDQGWVSLGGSLYSRLPVMAAPIKGLNKSERARLRFDIKTARSIANRQSLKDFRDWMQRTARDLYRGLWLAQQRRADVLSVIELENLRRHVDIGDDGVTAVLPYAEDVIEQTHEALGDRYSVHAKRDVDVPTEGWDFLRSALPPLTLKSLPPPFLRALHEVFEISRPVIGGYLTLPVLVEILTVRLAEFDAYLRVLRKIKPKALFMYNWEGVFRPLTTAALLSGCRVVGVQQALGPYLHALDHKRFGYYSVTNPLGFATPHKIALWGDMHKEQFLDFGYREDQLVVTGYARVDKHARLRAHSEESRNARLKRLKLPTDCRYLMFTGQSKVLDTLLLRDDHFIDTISTLCRLGQEFNFRIIMKPWTSDDMPLIEKIATLNRDRIWIAPQDVVLGNADLLAVTDWIVGTFSSILGEATVAGNACVLLNYPESRYYFDLPHVENYRGMMPFVDQPQDLEAALRPLLEHEAVRRESVEAARNLAQRIFGPCDGQAASRITALILQEAGVRQGTASADL
ncbi:hypothetical protein [Achromobacter spanius]|uniref:hypothetical protein n=1 Tax=Achromobacter spanius TaxID=217203 RepID=UPI000F83444A|nr:hypothetical protein [Achromobacter spanius]